MKKQSLTHISSFFLQFFLGSLLFAFPAHAQDMELPLPEGETLLIQGENFTFEKILTEIDGVEVFEEQAVWQGNVTASFAAITLTTERIEAEFDGTEVSVIRASPTVSIEGLDGRAVFECSDVEILFPTENSGLDNYVGTCNNVHGFYLANAREFGLEGDEVYEINFTADTAWLGPDSAMMENPLLTLGNPENPTLAFRSHHVDLPIGLHPVSGERAVLGIEATDLSVVILGYRLNILPFPVRRGLVPVFEPGFACPLPRPGWEGDSGFEWDQSVTYDFNAIRDGYGPEIELRFDVFPADRTYPELRFRGASGDFIFLARAGYRREEDPDGDSVPIRAEPEFELRTSTLPLLDGALGLQTGVFWGYLRDMTLGSAGQRYGYQAELNGRHQIAENLSFGGNLEYTDRYYSGNGNYATLTGNFRLKYLDFPSWGASISYFKVLRWGTPGFRFDEPQTIEQLGFREHSRFSRRWGGGFDWAWDFYEDGFERQEFHVTYILDSFQVSLGWDFWSDSAKVYFALPGSFR